MKQTTVDNGVAIKPDRKSKLRQKNEGYRHMKIYLVRHGRRTESGWSFAGQTDIALNAQGLEQAREAAERLKRGSV